MTNYDFIRILYIVFLIDNTIIMNNFSPDMVWVGSEYGSTTAKEYNAGLSKEIDKTKNILSKEKMQNISEIVYKAVNNQTLTVSDYQFSKEDAYNNNLSDKTDTYVNMNISYRYIKSNMQWAWDIYNTLGKWYNFKKDSPKVIFEHLKDKFISLWFNKKFENWKRTDVNFASDTDFLYVVGLFQAVAEDKIWISKNKDFRIWPKTLKALSSWMRFEIQDTNLDQKNNTQQDLLALEEWVIQENIKTLSSELIGYWNDFFDITDQQYEDLKKNIEKNIANIVDLKSRLDDTSPYIVELDNLSASYDKLMQTITNVEHTTESNNNESLDSRKYLSRLFALDNTIDKNIFEQEWNAIEPTFPKFSSEKEKDALYDSIYYGLYDLKNKFTDPKVKKEIASLMKDYDVLFDKYDNFYGVWDKVVDELLDEWIFGDDLKNIEDFFDKEWSRENIDSHLKKNTVSWSSLSDDEWDIVGQKTRILATIQKLIDRWEIGSKELGDFKIVMLKTREVFSNIVDGLILPSGEQKKSVDVVVDDNNVDIESQKKFEKPIWENAKSIQSAIQKNKANEESVEINSEPNQLQLNNSMERLWTDMKEFEKNKQLFASKLATKFEQRNNELSSSATREKVKIFIKKINDDIQEIEAILADYDDKIAKNATIAVELSWQKQAYFELLSDYTMLLSRANKKLTSFVGEKSSSPTKVSHIETTSQVQKKSVDASLNVVSETSDPFDLSKELLSKKNLSDKEIKHIASLLEKPVYLDRQWKQYNINKLSDVKVIIASGINTASFRNRRDNLVYIYDRLKNISQ